MSSTSDGEDRVHPDYDFLLRNSFMLFVKFAFSELYPQTDLSDSPHLWLLAMKLEECAAGRCKRLIICLPPRSLKSILTSVAFPAWVLGRVPHKQIICASYGQDLADKHARDCRTLINSQQYQSVFQTHLSREKLSVNDFMTTAGGFRMATSVGGVLTGRGGDMLIIDDPLKPADAYSETFRSAANSWYDNTLVSRLNNKQEGVIIVVMQRLHQDDLVGHLLEKDEGWEVIRLPAIAEENEHFEVHNWLRSFEFRRKQGEVLDPSRESIQTLTQLRSSMGSYAFEAQYQQNPQPQGGAIVKTVWLRYYMPADPPPRFAYKLQSWDTANKSGELNDFSVCTTWGVQGNNIYLLDVYRNRLEYPELLRAVIEQHRRHKPHRVVVEDKGSGTQLLQQLRSAGIPLSPYIPPPGNDKQMRLYAQSAAFENGRVFLPQSAPWLAEYVRELTGFPGTKFDDQVDSTTQALDDLHKRGSQSCTIRELIL